ncbi:hypothetical protein GCM10028801_33130 [Nocardioides maradonensis]
MDHGSTMVRAADIGASAYRPVVDMSRPPQGHQGQVARIGAGGTPATTLAGTDPYGWEFARPQTTTALAPSADRPWATAVSP